MAGLGAATSGVTATELAVLVWWTWATEAAGGGATTPVGCVVAVFLVEAACSLMGLGVDSVIAAAASMERFLDISSSAMMVVLSSSSPCLTILRFVTAGRSEQQGSLVSWRERGETAPVGRIFCYNCKSSIQRRFKWGREIPLRAISVELSFQKEASRSGEVLETHNRKEAIDSTFLAVCQESPLMTVQRSGTMTKGRLQERSRHREAVEYCGENDRHCHPVHERNVFDRSTSNPGEGNSGQQSDQDRCVSEDDGSFRFDSSAFDTDLRVITYTYQVQTTIDETSTSLNTGTLGSLEKALADELVSNLFENCSPTSNVRLRGLQDTTAAGELLGLSSTPVDQVQPGPSGGTFA